jgi:hypothetical protein
MLLGYDDAKKVDGYFYEFEYETRIKRTEKSANFACFKGNDHLLHIIKRKVYFHNDRDFNHIINNWNIQDHYGIYSYFPLGITDKKALKATQVVERIFNKENKYRLAFLAELGSVDFIQ